MSDELRISAHESLRVVRDEPGCLEVEATYEPGGSAPPPHLHPAQDEHFDIVAGRLHVEVDRVARDLDAGDTIDIPRGSVHRMWNTGTEPARVRWRTEPALRTKSWFEGLDRLQRAADERGKERADLLGFAALAHGHRDTFRPVTALPAVVTDQLIRLLAAVQRFR